MPMSAAQQRKDHQKSEEAYARLSFDARRQFDETARLRGAINVIVKQWYYGDQSDPEKFFAQVQALRLGVSPSS